ncbi:hypothetical protein IV203_033128 [Nitzschia inconspicua]|uniref:Uncharacterized protein n=1 Tax=Nitzschia inconspicua TaxID=303405 RepID=A0A9K3PFG1_9STRA|nr:hypothetical protein IV203_033128 [Nitzschia inconspicua]
MAGNSFAALFDANQQRRKHQSVWEVTSDAVHELSVEEDEMLEDGEADTVVSSTMILCDPPENWEDLVEEWLVEKKFMQLIKAQMYLATKVR